MNILSLFDGVSCAYVALERAGIKVDKYYSSEIEKNALKVSEKNYPNIIRLGSVVGLSPPLNIDLLIGGSPCQDLSIAKKDRKGLDGERSSLFWEFVRIKNEIKPKWFILENVASMTKEARDIITREIGVEPVMFNASLVSAQCRKRLFWTNIPFELPEDKGILLKDILEPDAEVDERMVVKGKSFCLTASYNGAIESNSVARKQRTMVLRGRDVILNDSPLQVLQEGRTELGRQSRKEIKKNSGKDSTSRSSGHKAYFGKDGTKANCLTTALGAEGLIVKQDRIRKLTPIECERLQGLPDNYTEGIAMTNRYKCLGNAFNVDVVAHILKSVKRDNETNFGGLFR